MTTIDPKPPAVRLREKLARDEPLVVVNADHPSASLVEVLARQPIDAVFIDCEQGSPDVESVENMARAARLHRMASLVRVFDPKDWVLERYLLRGVDGVVAPRIDRAADAQAVVEGVRYCFPDAPESKFIVVQIESAAAVAELDDFLAIEGIDVYFIGPVDLAKSMGHRGDFRHPEVQEMMDDIIARGRAAGRPRRHPGRRRECRRLREEGRTLPVHPRQRLHRRRRASLCSAHGRAEHVSEPRFIRHALTPPADRCCLG